MGRLPAGPATEASVADLEACGGHPDRDLVWRLATALGADPDAPALLIAEGVWAESVRGGWAGKGGKGRGVEVRVTYYL